MAKDLEFFKTLLNGLTNKIDSDRTWDKLKDKPFHEELKAIIEEREVHIWFGVGELGVTRFPQVGEKLNVTLNGVSYECVTWSFDNEVNLGSNEFIPNMGTNVPFFVSFYANGEAASAYVNVAVAGEGAISIVDNDGCILLEKTFNLDAGVKYPKSSNSFPLDLPLIAGNTCKVVYDGVSYECVVWEEDGCLWLGNGGIYGFEHVEDVPFLIYAYQDGISKEWLWILVCYGTDSHTVSVNEAVVHKLDPKFLPDTGGGVRLYFSAEGYLEAMLPEGDVYDIVLYKDVNCSAPYSFDELRSLRGRNITLVDVEEPTIEYIPTAYNLSESQPKIMFINTHKYEEIKRHKLFVTDPNNMPS